MHFPKVPHTLVARRPAASIRTSNFPPNKSNYRRINTSIYLFVHYLADLIQSTLVQPILSNNNTHYYPEHTETPIKAFANTSKHLTESYLVCSARKTKLALLFNSQHCGNKVLADEKEQRRKQQVQVYGFYHWKRRRAFHSLLLPNKR